MRRITSKSIRTEKQTRKKASEPNIIQIIAGFILMMNFFIIVGIAGGTECGTIPLLSGFFAALLILGISAVTALAVYVYTEDQELFLSNKNISEKTLDNGKQLCYNRNINVKPLR